MKFSQRLNRLEEKLGVKPQPYPHVIVTNVRFDDDECPVELVPGVYIEVIGRSLTPSEFEELRGDWRRKHVDEF
jgi:hypothetical protein